MPHTPPQWLMLLKWLAAALGYSLLVLLIRRGLWVRYRAFVVLIFVHSTVWLTDSWLSSRHQVLTFIAASVLSWMLYAYVVCEMFGRMFSAYPGIARTGRRFIALSMIVAVTAAFLTSVQDFGSHLSSVEILFTTIGERVVSAAIAFYLILMLLFLRWMPVPVPVNTARHTLIFFVYFVTSAAVYHFWNRFAESTDRVAVNSALALAAIFSFSAWAWSLRPEGESVNRLLRPQTPDAERILGQLESINRALGRGMAGH